MKKLQLFILLLCLPLLAFADGEAESYSVTFSPEGWATFYSETAVTVSEDVNVYIVTVSQDGATANADYVATMQLVELPTADGVGRYIPAPINNGSNPVVLQGTGTIDLNVLDDVDPQNLYASVQSDGLFIGIGNSEPYITNANGDYHNYVLGYTATYGTAFYEVAPGTTIPANRACIEISSAYSKPRIRVEINDAPTSIVSERQTLLPSDGRIYDLFGREITTPQRGQIYIRNNHKFIQD